MSNGVLESPLPSRAAAPVEISIPRRFYWALRRELWENRSIVLAPFGVAALFLVGFAISTAHLPAQMRAGASIGVPYDLAAGLMMFTVMLVGAFYSLDALYGERRDRSTLFWKSMPVSDLTTVLAKASIPFVLLPLLGAAVGFLMHLVMLLLSSAVVAANGQSVALLWTRVSFGQRSLLMLYHMVTAHGLWQWPVYAWLLMVSAWASRAPFLWAVVPPVAVVFLEKIAFSTTYLANVLLEHTVGGGERGALPAARTFPIDPGTHLTPARFFSAPSLWIGLAFAAVCLASTVRLRRSRGPI